MKTKHFSLLRRFAVLLLSFVMFSSAAHIDILPTASAVDTGPAYQAYYDIMQEYLRDIGTVKPSSVTCYDGLAFPDRAGLYFARVLDMDSDGYPELFLIESRYETPETDLDKQIEQVTGSKSYLLYPVLYTYKNGKVSKVLDIEFSIAPGGWSLCKASDGLTYFKIAGPQAHDKFYSVSNGKLVSQDFHILWSYDFSASGTVNGTHVWVHSDSAHSSDFFINDQSVSMSEYDRRLNAMERSVLEKYNFYTEKSSDSAVNETMQFITAHTPGSFLQCYSEPSSWAASSVSEAVSMGIIPRRLQKMYNQPITRAEFCELAANYYEKSTGTTITALADFSDTSAAAVRKMGGLGVISGTGAGKFSPDASLTREQAAVILVKLSEKLGSALPASNPDFTDNSSISSWASAQVGKAQAAGIMSGTGAGKFSPKSSYTREQSISTILRLNAAQPEVTSVKVTGQMTTILSGGRATLKAAAYDGSKEVGQVFTWTSSDPSVVSVDPYSGKITARSAGKATISAAAANGVSGSCTITVPQVNGNFYAETPVEKYITVKSSGLHTTTGKALFRIDSIERSKYASAFADQQTCVHMTLLEMPSDGYYSEMVLNWKIYNADRQLVNTGSTEEFIMEYDPGDSFTVNVYWFDMKGSGPFWIEFF